MASQKSYVPDPNKAEKATLPTRAIAVLANKVGINTTAERLQNHKLYNKLYKAAHAVKVAADFFKPAVKAAQYIAEGGAVSLGMAVPGASDVVLKAAKVAATGFLENRVSKAEARQEQRAAMAQAPKSRERARGTHLVPDFI
ncbi:hypothetical protein ACPA54_07480 [Uniformispora flossi]|uniref:hypothetical protein n=1 Tax=Uniformispora flossi TaxID=3390723 RepID=UPI003C2E8834